MNHISASSDHYIFKGRIEIRQANPSTSQCPCESRIDDTSRPTPFPNLTPVEVFFKGVAKISNTREKDNAQHVKKQKSATAFETKNSSPDLRASGRQVDDGRDGQTEVESVERKVRTALNKLIPETYDQISDTILNMIADSKQESDGHTMRLISERIIEIAASEAHLAPLYAKLCSKIIANVSNEIKDEGVRDKAGNIVRGANLFRKFLLNSCQKEFQDESRNHLPQETEGESEDVALQFDKYFKTAMNKRRRLGLTRFIGELFMVGLVTEQIMHACLVQLLDYEGISPDVVDMERLAILLRTVGKQLVSTQSKASGRMDAYFERIDQTINLPDLPLRIKYVLMDVVDLRKAGWRDNATEDRQKTKGRTGSK